MFGIPRLYAMIGAGIVIALFLAWVWRIDSLRAAHKRELAECQANFAQFQADVKAKTELARISDAAHKARVERDQNERTMRNEDEIRRRIAAAVAAVRVRPQSRPADPGSRRSEAMPSAPTPSNGADGAGADALVPIDDLEICAENSIKAKGWQDWWKDQQAVER